MGSSISRHVVRQHTQNMYKKKGLQRTQEKVYIIYNRSLVKQVINFDLYQNIQQKTFY